jgi:hypothetical protein
MFDGRQIKGDQRVNFWKQKKVFWKQRKVNFESFATEPSSASADHCLLFYCPSAERTATGDLAIRNPRREI